VNPRQRGRASAHHRAAERHDDVPVNERERGKRREWREGVTRKRCVGRPDNIWGVVRHTPPRARLAAAVPLTHRGAATAERAHRAKRHTAADERGSSWPTGRVFNQKSQKPIIAEVNGFGVGINLKIARNANTPSARASALPVETKGAKFIMRGKRRKVTHRRTTGCETK